MKQLITLVTAIFMAIFTIQAQVLPTIVGQGFVNGLIGVEVDADGSVWVTEYGTGNDDGTVKIINTDGSTTTFMTGLPSALNPLTGEIAGSFRTYQMSNNKVAILVGEGPHAQGEALIFVDKDDFAPGSPLDTSDVEQVLKFGDFVHSQGLPQSDPYNIAWSPSGDLLVADAGANAILRRELATGNLSFAAQLPGIPNPLPFGPPMMDAVPTDIVPKPDGSGYYVCQLTGFPFIDSVSTIFNLDNSGNLTPWQTGFTLITDMGYDPKDGNLCVLQFSRFGPVDTTLSFYPGAGRVIKLWPDGNREVIAENFIGFAPSFTFDAAGDLYVTDLFGFVYKYDFLSGTGEQQALAAKVSAYPNPFTERVSIGFELEKAANVRLNVYDLNGRLVHTIAEQRIGAGSQILEWNAGSVQAGAYFYHLLVDGRVASGLLEVVR